MGYYSSLHGELVIEPPLEWVEYRNSRFHTQEGSPLLKLVERVEEQQTDDGSVTVRVAVGVAAALDEAKAYTIDEEITALAETFGSTHRFAGHIVRAGEDTGDVERHWIDGTTARSEKAILSWPDGTEVGL